MLTFVDEAGDPGLKFSQGSSSKFAVTAVHFKDVGESERCSKAIDDLRISLGLSPYKEFHFSKDCPNLKRRFLECVSGYDFVFGAFVLDKPLLTGPGFRHKESLYKWTVRMTFKSIEDLLDNTTIVFDRCGGREFTKELNNYLKKRSKEWSAQDGRPRIKSVLSQEAHKSNLLQLADMACGAVFRSYSDRQNAGEYRRIIRKKEHRVELWPAQKKTHLPIPSFRARTP